MWGLYAFMTAACLSLLMNHVALHYHRAAALAAAAAAAAAAQRATKLTSFGGVETSDDDEGLYAAVHLEPLENGHAEALEAQALSRHVFRVGGVHVRVRPWGRRLVVALIAVALALLLYGANCEAFEFQVQGLAGLAMHAGDPGAHSKQFTLFNTATAIAEQAGSGDNVAAGILYIAGVYLGFALVMPVLQLTVFLVLWVAPLTLRQHSHMVLLAEVVSAWSAVEVFLVAVVVALLEIGQVSQFMVDDACAPVEQVMNSLLVPYGILRPRDATCFYVQASILRGCYVLLAAEAVATLVCIGVRRCAEAAMHERQKIARGWVLHDGTHCAPYSPQFMCALLLTLSRLRLVEVSDPATPEARASGAAEEDAAWSWPWLAREGDDAQRRRAAAGALHPAGGSGSDLSDGGGSDTQGCPPRGGIAGILRRALQSPERARGDGAADCPTDPPAANPMEAIPAGL